MRANLLFDKRGKVKVSEVNQIIFLHFFISSASDA